MQEHVLIGAQILKSEGIDVMARNIALYHHEKWDGTGYVNHLTGEAIPLEARIVAITDVYDALVSERIYKAVFSEEMAEQLIREESGKHFDPRLVAIFSKHKRTIQAIRTTLEPKESL